MIPSNLENKKKRVVIKKIEDKGWKRVDDYLDEFDYLISAAIALEVKAISTPTYPLVENSGKNLLKLYLNDVGILSGIFYRNNIKAVMLAPQCSSRRAWDETKADVDKATTMSEALKALIDHYVANNTKVDPSKIYILGYSDSPQPAGAGGVWRMLSDYTDLFAAGMVVAADPDEEIVAANIAKTPLLVVNGASDVHAVGVELATFIDEVKEAGGEIREVVLNIRSREELCRDAFTAEHLSWVLQF
jgi:predicted peptidase